MKISEVRSTIEKYSSDQLKLIIAELYKALPKAVRDDADLDGMLKDPGTLTSSERKAKRNKLPNLELLKNETEAFINNAYAQNYLSPNRFVSKQNRPKWRFIVKRLYKDILSASTTKDNEPEAARLLAGLYSLLCYSCRYTLFTAYDSFESTGIIQEEFFRTVLSLKNRCEDKNTFIKNAVFLLVSSSLNRYTLYEDLMQVILEFAETTDLRERVIAVCSEMIDEIRKESVVKKDSRFYDEKRQADYEKKEKINILTTMAFLSYARLYEYSEAISFFRANYYEEEKEVALYVLLNMLFRLNQKDHFLKEFEKALAEGIKPRESLKRAYRFTRDKGELPPTLY